MVLELPNGHPIEVQALLDSGASANLFSRDFALKHQLHLLPLDFPLQVTTIDGRELLGGEVTHQTPPMRMRVSRHVETIAFHVATLAGPPIILGMI